MNLCHIFTHFCVLKFWWNLFLWHFYKVYDETFFKGVFTKFNGWNGWNSFVVKPFSEAFSQVHVVKPISESFLQSFVVKPIFEAILQSFWWNLFLRQFCGKTYFWGIFTKFCGETYFWGRPNVHSGSTSRRHRCKGICNRANKFLQSRKWYLLYSFCYQIYKPMF